MSNNFVLQASAYLDAVNANNFSSANTNIDHSIDNIGLGFSNIRLSESNTTTNSEMTSQSDTRTDIAMKDNGWDADVEMDGKDISDIRVLDSCKGHIPTPYNRPSNVRSKTWSNSEYTVGQYL